MKTAIDIADDLLVRSKQVSGKREVLLREFVEEGLLFLDRISPSGRICP
jgi:hypothetical protein